jgi:hypothetical protein
MNNKISCNTAQTCNWAPCNSLTDTNCTQGTAAWNILFEALGSDFWRPSTILLVSKWQNILLDKILRLNFLTAGVGLIFFQQIAWTRLLAALIFVVRVCSISASRYPFLQTRPTYYSLKNPLIFINHFFTPPISSRVN